MYVSYIYHMMFIYIFCTSTPCMLCTSTTCWFPSPSATQPRPLPIFSLPTSSRGVPPYVPWFCLRFLPDLQGVFSCPCCHCACSKGVQRLRSVKRLEKMILFWRHINKIELNDKHTFPVQVIE